MQQIEHFIVLMLENRSFDHMFGFLDHPDTDFRVVGRLPNPPAACKPNARYAIYPGPDHSHEGVLHQMFGAVGLPSEPQDSLPVTMLGFPASYELVLRSHGITNGNSDKVMRCLHPDMVPVMSTLAKEFVVCDQWFCSLPGETWPNRDYLHAGTSFSHVNIHHRPIWSNPPTIFSLMEAENNPALSWRVYHQGVAHVLIYSQLFFARPDRRGSHAQLLADIRADRLPSYAFVEPDYGLPGAGNSQHPSQARSREEFVNGEQFIADIYNALRDTPDVFEKTAFIITYDEHGGFYDHYPPPKHRRADHAFRDGQYRFSFGICGPRVPGLVISPWVKAGHVDHVEREHSCIAETIRKRFLHNALPLNDRAEGTDLGALFDLPAPRRGAELPTVQPLTQQRARELEAQLAAPPDAQDTNPILDVRLQTTMNDLRGLIRSKGIPI